MSFVIRKADPADFEAVHAMLKEFATFISTPDKVLTTPAQMVCDSDVFRCLIALEGDKPVGFATYFMAYYSWTGKAIYLDDLYVKEEYRGRGIGSALFDFVLKMGREAECKKMKWQVSNWNEKAQAFYKSRGAVIDAVEINCDLMLEANQTI